MKKILAIVLATLCAAALLGGCKSKTTPNENKTLSNNYISIKKYVGLEVEKQTVQEVTDKDVEDSIKSDLETLATFTDITNRAAQLGDVTTIDFVGKIDGVAFDGGTGTDFELELGSKTFIEGFEDGVAGMKLNETRNLNLKFPEDYGKEELNGKAVVFTVTLKKIQEKNVPELTDAILDDLGTSAKTVDEYKAQVKADLEKSNKETAEMNLQNAVYEALIEQCTVKKYPDGMVEQYVADLEEQYYYYAYIYGMETEEFVQQAFGMSMEEVAKKQIALQLAIEFIATAEKLTVSDADYKAGVAELATQYGYEDVATFESEYGADTIRNSLLQDKVGSFLVENSKQVEKTK